jgi:hypothetical protein
MYFKSTSGILGNNPNNDNMSVIVFIKPNCVKQTIATANGYGVSSFHFSY